MSYITSRTKLTGLCAAVLLASLGAGATTAHAQSFFASQNGYTLQPTGADIFGDLAGATAILVPPGHYVINAQTGINTYGSGGVASNASAQTVYCTIFVNGAETGTRGYATIPAYSASDRPSIYASSSSIQPVTVALVGKTNRIQYICCGSNQLQAIESSIWVTPYKGPLGGATILK